MRTPDLLRDSFFGRIAYHVSGRRLFQHPEEHPNFVLPRRYAAHLAGPSLQTRHFASSSESLDPPPPGLITNLDVGASSSTLIGGITPGIEAKIEDHMAKKESTAAREVLHRLPQDTERVDLAATAKEEQRAHEDPNIVDWYGPDDPECPRNWSLAKRCFVTCQIGHLTFAVFIGSSIYAPGTADLSEKFGISVVAANLGITLFVLGYAFGPMILAPMSEIPQTGRVSVYMITLLIFMLLQIPTALAKNLGALLPLRFWAAFFGSPVFATGGATIADMWPPETQVIAMSGWTLSAMCGPSIGPVIGGFAVQAKGWTWTIWIMLWLTGATWVFLAFTMPETSPQAILYSRAVRLRKLTGNPNLRTQAEIEGENMTMKEVAMMTIVRPFYLGFSEPVVLFWNLYVGLAYGIQYCFVASYNVIFTGHHGFNLGQNGLTFLGIVAGGIVGFIGLVPWALYVLRPKFTRGEFVPEDRLPIAFPGAFCFSIAMFWFGWTSGAGVPWIVPVIASAVWSLSVLLLFQAGLNYLADCYPRHVASVMASNDLFRAIIGAAFPLFSTAFFNNLGVGPAMSIIGGITVLMLPVPFVLYRHGAKIRSWSKYTG